MPMSLLPTPASGTDEHGYTMIELLIAMTIGSVVILAAFSLLRFTTSDVSRITARVHVDQRGRLALEKIMLELHSACVAPTVVPIREKSTENELRFISEYSPLNSEKEPTPTSELATVRLHRILYTPPTEKFQGTLIEESWPSTGTPPHYKFNESETPTKVKLLNNIQQSLNKEGKLIPVFKYYRYYNEKDHEPTYGQIDPTALNLPSSSPLTEKEAKNVTKVAISFSLGPEGSESATFANDRAVALEDSAIFRLAPSSETASESNLPCTTES
jgi:prepilin-type N-terminal cleavage/methylation domain-containing protein